MTMQKLRAAQPYIMVGRLPIRSSANAGARLPMGNIKLTQPAKSKEVLALRPTLVRSTVGM